MAPLTLTSTYTPNETSISNIFLDTFMPSANGEFVKVYLCLLRMFSDPKHDPATLSDIADLLNHTEGDVIRAIRYWEKAGLLSVGYKDNCPSDITLLPITEDKPAPANAQINRAAEASCIPPLPAAAAEAPPESEAAPLAEKIDYSPSALKRLCEDENIRQTLYVAEQLLGKTLTTSEANTILYIYNELDFSDELLEYLLEYCVSNEKRSLRYIEKVAVSWHREGISTVEQAKNQHEIHSRRVFSVMKAFGIDDRRPGKPELDYIARWYDEYGFEVELVIEACNRTIQSLHKPSFEYADTILSNWKKKNVHTLSDIEAVDSRRPKRDYNSAVRISGSLSAAGQGAGAGGNIPRSTNNRFNNFTQRSYDFTAIEKKLAGKKENIHEAE